MKNVPIKDRRRIWKNIVAISAFKEAEEALGFIATNLGNGLEHKALTSSLWTSLVISYCRPFTSNGKIGPIDSDLIPPERKRIHDLLMNMRNKVSGHTDDRTEFDDGNPLHQASIKKEGNELISIGSFGHPEVGYTPEILLLIQEVRKNCENRWRYQINKYINIEDLPEKPLKISLTEECDNLFINET